MESKSDHQIHPSPPSRHPKRFIKSQIPDSITSNPALNSAISLLPPNYNFEIHKSIHRILSTNSRSVALQFPEGLLMFSLPIADILSAFTPLRRCFILSDVTYGACCVDDLSASALGADLLIHYGHSCLVPVDHTSIPCLYVFVDIQIDVPRLATSVKLNFTNLFHPNSSSSSSNNNDNSSSNDNNNSSSSSNDSILVPQSNTELEKLGFTVLTKQIVLAGTIQFASAIRAAKTELEKLGFTVLVPQAKPLSAGEVLGCTAPVVKMSQFSDDGKGWEDVVLIFVADGRFHLEAFMIANPRIKAYRYDPYLGQLFLEEYDHKGMKEGRKEAIMRARGARNWGIVFGTLGRQGNPRVLQRLERKMREKGMSWTVVMVSELSPARMALFGDSVDAWVQIACPRLSIDWGDAFVKPLLTPFEVEIALGDLPGWWEKKEKKGVGRDDSSEGCCGGDEKCLKGLGEDAVDYPMDYYAQDGGEWNSCYTKKQTRPSRRNNVLK